MALSKRIVLIEDDRDISSTLRGVLESNGHKVVAAPNAQALVHPVFLIAAAIALMLLSRASFQPSCCWRNLRSRLIWM